MKSKFIAGVTAAAIALTSMTAAPAYAGRDVAKIAAGLAALFIIGKAIEDNNRSSSATAQRVQRNDTFNNRYGNGQLRNEPYHNHRARGLPQQCFRVLGTSDGNRRVFGKRCLERNYRAASRLPGYCETTLRVNGQRRTFYNARCLRNEGFRMAGR